MASLKWHSSLMPEDTTERSSHPPRSPVTEAYALNIMTTPPNQPPHLPTLTTHYRTAVLDEIQSSLYIWAYSDIDWGDCWGSFRPNFLKSDADSSEGIMWHRPTHTCTSLLVFQKKGSGFKLQSGAIWYIMFNVLVYSFALSSVRWKADLQT